MSTHNHDSAVSKQLRLMGQRITWVLVALGLVLVVLEFIVHRHGEIDLEDLPLFPAIYGFVAFVLIVFVGIGLRKLIMRGEDYYGDQ